MSSEARPETFVPESGLTPFFLYDKMLYMAKVSVPVRELQQNLERVMARVERGETVEVTRRRKPVARLTPVLTRQHPRSDGPISKRGAARFLATD